MMFSIIKRAIKIFYFKLLRVSWYLPTRKSINQFAGQVHVLVVKNTSYINFSRICIESFLHFHPQAKVILHCDTSTFNNAKRFFWVTSRYKNVSIICDQKNESDWKFSKFKLLLSMNGTSDIFIDADMRWNGSLSLDKNIYFLVREFPLWKSPEYIEFFSSVKIELNEKKYMWNTSFFTFNSIRINENVIKRMYEFYEKLTLIYESNGKEFNSNSIKERLIEQLTLSYFADEFGFEVKALKENDSRLDGSLVESAYFGSTGLGF